MSVRKSFVMNNDFAKLTQSHIVQLFKPSYNPKLDDEAYVASKADGSVPTKSFALQYYPQTISGTKNNPVVCPYNTKNVVAGMFLVTENFLTFINKLNNIWYNDILPKQITPITYTANPNGTWAATADTSRQSELIGYFAGPSANWASGFLQFFENYAAVGIEGSTSMPGATSSSVQELVLRHLYSMDADKRAIAFDVAQNYYGISAAECAAAKNEMFPAADFDSDNFVVSMTDDVITFNYNKPIALASKYVESTHNSVGANLYLYFPYITSNSMRGNDDTKYDYRNLISLYTGPKSDSQAITPTLSTASNPSVYFAPTFCERGKTVSGSLAALQKYDVPNMPTLVNTIWSSTKNKMINQAGYTALHISEVGGGGDVQFDHIDKIDYIDSLTIEITVPTVFS